MANENMNHQEVDNKIVDQATTDTSENEGEKNMKKESLFVKAKNKVVGTLASIPKKHPTATKVVGLFAITFVAIAAHDGLKELKRANYPAMPLDKNDPIDTTFTPVPEDTESPVNTIETNDVFSATTASDPVFDNNTDVFNF